MSSLAAVGDIWGISGPAFLLGYGVLAAAVLAAGQRTRRALADRGSDRPTGDVTAHPHDVAYVNSGPELAVYSALSSMHVAGTVVTAGRGRVQGSGRIDHHTADELERSIHFTAAAPIPMNRLRFHRSVGTALDGIERRLVDAGLLLGADDRRAVRQVGFWMLAVAGLGLVRLLAGVANAQPVGYLVVTLLVVTAIAVGQLASAPRRSRLGDRTLERLRDEHHELTPGLKPDWAVYGAAGARRSASGCSGRARCGRPTRRSPTSWLCRRWSGPAAMPGTRAGAPAAPVGEAAAVEAVVAAGAGAEPSASRLGVGIGWRPEISGLVGALPDLRFCEVIAESLGGSAPPRALAELRSRGLPVIPHGVALSLGGAEPVEVARVTRLAACAVALDAPLVSEHIAFVRAGGHDVGHLLPVPRSREALDALCANVLCLTAELDVPLALEPVAALFDWPDDELTEAEFHIELMERTDALLLLDVANVYANAVNRGTTPRPCSTRCRWSGSPTCTWAAAASPTASTTTRTPTPSRPRCSTCSQSCTTGTPRPR